MYKYQCSVQSVLSEVCALIQGFMPLFLCSKV